LFMDEIGDIPLALQPKLLRVLQDQEFERLGSTRTIRTNVRLIAATHCNLGQNVKEGKFRADLFYRFNVFPITTPPLRERLDDIPQLIRHFTWKYAERMNKRIEIIPCEAMEILMTYSWPGNIRELQNFIQRAVILSCGPALYLPLDELMRLKQECPTEPITLKEAERAHILRTLKKPMDNLPAPQCSSVFLDPLSFTKFAGSASTFLELVPRKRRRKRHPDVHRIRPAVYI